MSLKLNSSGGGSVTLQEPVTASNLTLTLPASTGTVATTTDLTSLNASNLTSGTVPDARFPATLPAASGVNLTALNASNLGSGTVPTARLATGTANSTTFLRGDQTWATAGGAPANLGDIGTIAVAATTGTSYAAAGSTIAGTSVYLPTTFVSAPNGQNGYILTQGASTSARPNTLMNGFLQGAVNFGYVNRTDSGNVGFQAPGGFTVQSGTWRVLWILFPRTVGYDPCSNLTESRPYTTLLQRIA